MQESIKKPAFHIMKKKNFELKKKESINIEVQTSFQKIQLKDQGLQKLKSEPEPEPEPELIKLH